MPGRCSVVSSRRVPDPTLGFRQRICFFFSYQESLCDFMMKSWVDRLIVYTLEYHFPTTHSSNTEGLNDLHVAFRICFYFMIPFFKIWFEIREKNLNLRHPKWNQWESWHITLLNSLLLKLQGQKMFFQKRKTPNDSKGKSSQKAKRRKVETSSDSGDYEEKDLVDDNSDGSLNLCNFDEETCVIHQ